MNHDLKRRWIITNATNLTRYIVSKCTKENEPINNLQLQTILYCIQIEFVRRGKVAFYDNMEAWKFGPVLPNVYYTYCGFGANPITMNYPNEKFPSPEDRKIIDPIVENKRKLLPWELETLTHDTNGAWAQTYRSGEGEYSIIPRELMM